MAKVVPGIFIGLVLLTWLGDPHTAPALNILITGAWNGFVRGVVIPVTTIVTQVAMVCAIGYVVYLFIRRRFRR